jgi:tetratricopeptide (TPR) repeat protein
MTSPRIQQLKQLLIDEPNDSFLNYALALEFAKVNETRAAIKLMQQVVQMDNNYLGAYYQLGKMLEQTKQLNEAIIVYKKGIAIATQQKNRKAISELNEALMQLEEE